MISDDSVPFARSVIVARDLAYDDLGLPLTGLLCWDEAQDGPRPRILLIHGGAGLDEHAREQARRYAAVGYAVLACDMFGPGWRGTGSGSWAACWPCATTRRCSSAGRRRA